MPFFPSLCARNSWCVYRTFLPERASLAFVALAVYAVDEGNVLVEAANFSSSFLSINAATQAPPVYIGTSAQFSMQFNYSAGAVLRAVTETRVLTGTATSFGVLGPAYVTDYAQLWIIRTPVPGFQTVLTFTTFDTEGGYDFVTVYDGVTGGLSPLRRLSGRPAIPLTVSTTSEGMAVLFTSDRSTTGQGFAASFAFVAHVSEAGSINCTGACYTANVQYKW
jgi:hypothetical protein